MAQNPALQPAETPVEGDNLTSKQAALILACLEADPNGVLQEAEELELTEDDVNDLIDMLSEMAGEDEGADEGEEDGGDDAEI